MDELLIEKVDDLDGLCCVCVHRNEKGRDDKWSDQDYEEGVDGLVLREVKRVEESHGRDKEVGWYSVNSAATLGVLCDYGLITEVLAISGWIADRVATQDDEW